MRGPMFEAGRRARALTAVLAVVVALGVGAASAAALPAKFFGVVPQSALSQEEFNTLRRGGVKTMRVPLIWGAIQPRSGGAYEWGSFDPLVERAARSGIELLPFVVGAPSWAVREADVPGARGAKAPAHLPARGGAARAWRSLLRAAVARYEPGGSFWSENPLLRPRPITTWQIWNEPNFKYFVARPNPAEYGRLVKLSAGAIRSTDPSAQVILAGLFAKPAGARRLAGRKVKNRRSPNWFASYFLERMYKANPGIKSRFQGVSLHPYVARYRRLPGEIREVRRALARAGDGRKGLWITELGWSSEPPRPGAQNVFQVGPAGQARELKGAFTLLRNDAARFRLRRVYWFSVDDDAESCNFCDGSGLFRDGFVPKRSWTEFQKFTRGTR